MIDGSDFDGSHFFLFVIFYHILIEDLKREIIIKCIKHRLLLFFIINVPDLGLKGLLELYIVVLSTRILRGN
jgi:hypothetical protein